MGLDALDAAGEIRVEMELVYVFGFSLCFTIFSVFGDALLLHLLLQGRLGYR